MNDMLNGTMLGALACFPLLLCSSQCASCSVSLLCSSSVGRLKITAEVSGKTQSADLCGNRAKQRQGKADERQIWHANREDVPTE
jgi:hypothetical protein